MPILTSEQNRKLKKFVIEEAHQHGFDAVAITAPDNMEQAASRLQRAVAAGFHGTMQWMEETLERRSSPKILWPEVRSIIVLALNYGPEEDPRLSQADPSTGLISVYARHRDYHDLIKGRLKQMAGRFAARAKADVKVFVDTAPILEKPLAQQAGLGWQGKHTNLVSREHGSWLFLGSIFTTAELEPDQAEIDHCGSCHACQSACPTNAFPAPYQLDARRCISYLTIEHKGMIDDEFRHAIGNRIYGCDDCLAACPWNKFAHKSREAKLQPRHDLIAPPLKDLLQLDDAAFRQFFSGSPIKRIGRNGFLRNVLIACGNSQDTTLVPFMLPHLQDNEPIVRAMAVWAIGQLVDCDHIKSLFQHYGADEQDQQVIPEWEAVL